MIITKEHIGRKVRNNTHAPVTVLAINGDSFWSVDDNGYYETWVNDPYWQLVEDPKPKLLPSERMHELVLQRYASKFDDRSIIDAMQDFLDEHAEVFK